MTVTPLDAVISRLADASNALSEADDLPGDYTRLLHAIIDHAMVEAYGQQARLLRSVEDDGPDPDRLRDEWLDEQWRSQ